MKILHSKSEEANAGHVNWRGDNEEDRLPTEKGDVFAMVLSAFLTIFPFVAIILLLLVGVSWLLFLH